jgi:hypothetical protein
MTSSAGAEIPEWVDHLREWRQGDYTLDISQILLVTGFEDGDLVPKGGEAIGLVVISQTCDIVNWSEGKEWVTVAPLTEVNDAKLLGASRGTSPAWATLENPPAENVVADLNQMMTMHKSVLAGLARKRGFNTDIGGIRFAETLARKHGRFAFPDAFAQFVLAPLRTRIQKAHGKNSDQGKAYPSISHVRVAASPSWASAEIAIGFRFVLEPQETREVARNVISRVLSEHLSKIEWPNGYKPEDPVFTLQTAEEMSVREWLDSQPLDWDYISWSKART